MGLTPYHLTTVYRLRASKYYNSRLGQTPRQSSAFFRSCTSSDLRPGRGLGSVRCMTCTLCVHYVHCIHSIGKTGCIGCMGYVSSDDSKRLGISNQADISGDEAAVSTHSRELCIDPH